MDMVVKEVEIEFLCCKYDGFWNIPKSQDMKIVEVKYIFYGPVLPAAITKSMFGISEDDEAVRINKEIKLNNRRT